MEEDFLNNMKSYEQILIKESMSWFFISLIGLMLTFIFFFGLKKHKETEAIVMRIVSTIVFFLFFSLSLLLSIALKMDAKPENILIYQGEYVLYTKKTTTACYLTNLNDDKYNVIIGTGLTTGKENRYGYVVYTKHSKVVVDYGTSNEFSNFNVLS